MKSHQKKTHIFVSYGVWVLTVEHLCHALASHFVILLLGKDVLYCWRRHKEQLRSALSNQHYTLTSCWSFMDPFRSCVMLFVLLDVCELGAPTILSISQKVWVNESLRKKWNEGKQSLDCTRPQRMRRDNIMPENAIFSYALLICKLSHDWGTHC